jgi:predicted aldo/keto reductase-like oxidoreductase
MTQDFLHTTLGKTGLPVYRIGLSATYRPGKKAIYKAIDEGVNYFFYFGIDTQIIKVLKDVIKGNREKFIIATGAYNFIWWRQNFQKTLEKRLRQLGTDYIDIFMFLGVTNEKHFPKNLQDELAKLKESGKIRFTGMSTHARKFAGKLAEQDALDTMMIRYNAAHRGAETDIFPYVDKFNTGIISFTATRWRYLIRKSKNWPKEGKIPTPGMCYRFALSNPKVHVCMMAPTSKKQLIQNLDEIKKDGPLNEEEMNFMHSFGDAVYHTKKWFM